jgi:RNA polymerase sigma-70 factor (ECF subfamily)
LQLLPPRQRAALVLQDVLRLSAAEVAEVLDSSVASVNSSLQRARRTLRESGPALDEAREPTDPDEREVLERYVAAFEAADVPGLAQLLTDDVTLEMPPVDLWLQGRADYAAFLEAVFARRGPGWRMVGVPANGTTALATYAPDSGADSLRAHSLQVFELGDGRVSRCVTFADPSVLSLFGLPTTWEEER